MKSIILNAALIAMAIVSSGKAEAQVVRTIKGDNSVSCSAAATTGQTVVTGAWGISTNQSGSLVITDKDNNVVRMVADGGQTTIAGNGAQGADKVSYPFSLVVDKCGNLHITDNTIYSGVKANTPVVLAHEANSWSDPEFAQQPAIQGAVVSAKQP